jgi:hypothetical protein
MSLARGPRASDWCFHEVSVLPIGSYPAGADKGAPAHFIGLDPASARFWGHRCGLVFGPEPKFHSGRVLGGVLGPPVEMLLEVDHSTRSISLAHASESSDQPHCGIYSNENVVEIGSFAVVLQAILMQSHVR